ncbi:MAG: hypothetical protein GC162_15515 [Planctomycetes bacterium]|nr:hypothetical protein [Planctomycetota bacterium]
MSDAMEIFEAQPGDARDATIELILRYLDQSASDADIAQLSDTIASDGTAANLLVKIAEQRLSMRESLRRRATVSRIDSAVSTAHEAALRPRTRWRRPITALAAAIALIVSVGYVMQTWRGERDTDTTAARHHDDGPAVGVVVQGEDTLWRSGAAGDDEALTQGQSLSAGPMNSEGGRSEVYLLSGVNVSFIGKVQARLIDAMHMELTRGRVTIAVQEGTSGFTINAAGISITDLGTVFDVNVDDAGRVEVHVMEGKVMATLPGDARRAPALVTVNHDESVRLDPHEATVARFNNHYGRFDPPIPTTWHSLDAGGRVMFPPFGLPSYSNQDGIMGQPTNAALLDGDGTLHIWGNAWKHIDVDYDVTDRTILEFEFRSDAPGEMLGIGMDDDNNVGTGRHMLLLAGHDKQHPSASSAYYSDEAPSQWQLYRVAMGKHFKGRAKQIVFFADDDAHGKADAWFRHVRVYESDEASRLGVGKVKRETGESQ